MRIGLVSSAVPLVYGGGRNIVEWLREKLLEAKHEVEIIWIPQVDDEKTLYQQMLAFRMLDLNDSFDRIITFRPCAHLVCHHTKIVWFIHHIRTFYDLWDSEYNALPKTPYWLAYRDRIISADTTALREAKAVFTNSRTVSQRLLSFNGLESEVLYPPVLDGDMFHTKEYGDELVFICRIERHKRQAMAIEAMRHAGSGVRLRIAGVCNDAGHRASLQKLIDKHNLQDRVTLDARWISEAEKVDLLSTALAAVYIPLDEDSYGYPTLEAAHSGKATVTLRDSGGVMEFVEDGVSGIVSEADPRALGAAFDRLWRDRGMTERLGVAARNRIAALDIGWQRVIEKLTT